LSPELLAFALLLLVVTSNNLANYLINAEHMVLLDNYSNSHVAIVSCHQVDRVLFNAMIWGTTSIRKLPTAASFLVAPAP
jgi:hypothetical protein